MAFDNTFHSSYSIDIYSFEVRFFIKPKRRFLLLFLAFFTFSSLLDRNNTHFQHRILRRRPNSNGKEENIPKLPQIEVLDRHNSHWQYNLKPILRQHPNRFPLIPSYLTNERLNSFPRRPFSNQLKIPNPFRANKTNLLNPNSCSLFRLFIPFYRPIRN